MIYHKNKEKFLTCLSPEDENQLKIFSPFYDFLHNFIVLINLIFIDCIVVEHVQWEQSHFSLGF